MHIELINTGSELMLGRVKPLDLAAKFGHASHMRFAVDSCV
jgi:hypothetical protein